MKFTNILSETVSLAKTKNSNSDFELVPKCLRKFENTAEFRSWGIGRPGELNFTQVEKLIFLIEKSPITKLHEKSLDYHIITGYTVQKQFKTS